jgi:hypothetical protein
MMIIQQTSCWVTVSRDTLVTFNDKKHTRFIYRRWPYVQPGVDTKWYLLTWMNNVSQVAGEITNILPRNVLPSKLIYALTKIDRDSLSGLWRGVIL